jgi:hypothetical protein
MLFELQHIQQVILKFLFLQFLIQFNNIIASNIKAGVLLNENHFSEVKSLIPLQSQRYNLFEERQLGDKKRTQIGLI